VVVLMVVVAELTSILLSIFKKNIPHVRITGSILLFSL
jgi:small neutral amino acid transporter SnatA (MarC family)